MGPAGRGPPKTKAMTTPACKTHRFLWSFLVAFFICWVTQAIFWRIGGRRGSLLAFVLFSVEDFLRVTEQRVAGRQVSPYPPSAYAGSVIGAALLMALPLAGMSWVVGAENRVLRCLGFIVLAFLAFMTFYWPSIPHDLF
jgi:hypothetical protein